MPDSKNDASSPSIGKFGKSKHTISFRTRWIRTSSTTNASTHFSKSGRAGFPSQSQPCISKLSSPATSDICRAGASFFRNPSRSAMTFRQAKSWKYPCRQSVCVSLCFRRIRFQHAKTCRSRPSGLPTNERTQPSPAENLFLIVEMKLINPDGIRRGGYGRFVLPIKEA